jgi:PmbA protein
MSSLFTLSDDRLRAIAQQALDLARSLGASDAVADISESVGLSVSTRRAQVETIEHTRDKGLGVTVYVGTRRGNASTSDFAPAAVRQAVEAAYNIARFTAEDPAAGLPDEDTLERQPRELELFHPWDLQVEQAIEIARQAEQAAFAVSPRIVNSEGANAYTSSGHFVLANTRGFCAGFPYSRHSLSVTPIAQDGQGMQRDDWYSASRVAASLASPKALGEYAARRALARLSARRLKTRRVPVLFEAPLAGGLLGSFVQAASGGSLYRRASFLVDALGEPLFAPHVSIHEDPYVPRGYGSGAFDEEGVRSARRRVVDDGVLRGYFLSTYSARKLGMKSTGNAGGAYNLELRSKLTAPGDDFEAMLRKLGTGLLVTELIGHGINYVTGDYSRGASGFWVRNGEIAYPVEEITIAGNLREMFANVVAVGADRLERGGRTTGSVLIEGMTVGGA